MNSKIFKKSLPIITLFIFAVIIINIVINLESNHKRKTQLINLEIHATQLQIQKLQRQIEQRKQRKQREAEQNTRQ